MSTNPNNAVGTNGAYGGRTTVNALNDGLSVYTRGIMSGWACTPSSGLVITLGGDGTTRDVAIAQDNAGNKTTINNISGSPISVTIPAAPASNSRIDSVVAYVDNPPSGSATVVDNPSACGLIVVSGNVAANPTAPNESTIRSKITADGASGTTAYYVVLANITIASGTTTLTSGMISAGGNATIIQSAYNMSVLGGDYSTSEVDTGYTWIDGKHIYKKTINLGNLPNATTKTVNHNISGITNIIKFEGGAYRSLDGGLFPLPYSAPVASNSIGITGGTTEIFVATGSDRSNMSGYVTLYYTKNS